MTHETEPSLITSVTFGWPSFRRFVTCSTGRPSAAIIVAVPSVANSRKPASCSWWITGSISVLCRSAMLMSTPPPGGSAMSADISAFASAAGNVWSIPITSPVDFISGPRYVSTPISFDIENTGALTATRFCRGHSPGS